MHKHKYLTGMAAVLFVVGLLIQGEPLGAVFGIPSALAQEPFTITGGTISTISYIATLLITLTNVLVWLLFLILDRIMNPAWIFDLQNGGALTQMLRSIWVLCRDLVNLGLALGLIYAAIKMIVTADSSQIKEKAPKFVMALVLVNFSWFIPRVIFDVSQVLTYTVYQVPSLIGANACTMPATATQPAQPCEIVVNIAFFQQAQSVISGVNGWSCPLPGIVCLQSVPANSPAGPTMQMHSQVMNGLIVNHARLRTLIRIVDPQPVGEDVGAAIMFLVKVMIILFIHIAIFFPILALTVAFFIRIPIIWVTIAFMPLAALSYVFDMSFLGQNDPKEIFQKQYINMVMLPVKVAIPFTIGFIMVNAAANTAAPPLFAGAPPIPIFSGVSSLWQIIWMLVSITIIYKYSFKILEDSGGEFISGAVQKIKGYGDNAKSLITQAPLAVPLPFLGGATARDIGRMANPASALHDLETRGRIRLPGEILEERAKARAIPTEGRAAENAGKIVATLNEDQHNTINVSINNARDARDNAVVRMQQIENAITAARTASGGRLNGVNNADVLEGILRTNRHGLSVEEQQQLRKAMAESGRGGRTA